MPEVLRGLDVVDSLAFVNLFFCEGAGRYLLRDCNLLVERSGHSEIIQAIKFEFP